MTKAVSVPLVFILLLAGTLALPAQTNSPEATAVNQAVLRQANTIVLRQKLVQAQDAVAHGDLKAAASLYEEAYQLVQQIGSGIPAETEQTISGLASVRMQLARAAQRRGTIQGLQDAEMQVERVLKVQPQNAEAIAFKKHNDQMIAALRGRVPDNSTLQQVPAVAKQKTQADTLVRDGKLLYEMGKLEEAQAKLEQALKLDPGNEGGFYYLNLVKQALYARSDRQHAVDNETRMVQVSQAWEEPVKNEGLPVPNPYATNTLIHTGPGREVIMEKLNSIRLNKVFYDGLPLSEVVRDLSDQAKLRDPTHVGVNFLINPNPDLSSSVQTTAPPTTGAGAGGVPGLPGYSGGAGAPGAGGGGQAQINPATGLPMSTTPQTPGGQPADINSVIVRINPALNNLTLAEALNAIVQVASPAIEYSVNDYAVVFSVKGPNSPQLYNRVFRVDPNTFVQGLQSVSALTFINNNQTSSSGAGGIGGGGGGGANSQNQSSVGVVAIVNAAPGEAGMRFSQGGGGGGGGGYGGGAGGQQGAGGINYVTTYTNTVDVSVEARNFFATLGVDLNPPKSIFFNDRLGLLFVRATMQDLDTIESAIEALNQVAPEVHIATRFIEVDQTDNRGLGFQWYLGQFNLGSGVVAQGGTAPSLNTPGPQGTTVPFPGPTAANQILSSATDQQITSGLASAGPTLGTITGILTNPNFRLAIQALQQRTGYEELAAPEVTTISGRQTEMRATVVQQIETGFSFQGGTAATSLGGGGIP